MIKVFGVQGDFFKSPPGRKGIDLRVITGTARGTRLEAPEGLATRPTSDMAKEAMFSILHFELAEAVVLDLFAGSGQLGIEALSRGAKSALFVDKRADAVKLVRENLALCHLEENAQVICGDSLAALGTQSGRFDIIFLDPPYESGLLEQAMEKIAQFDILSPHGIMVAESPQNQTLPELPAPYGLYREYRYGKIKVSIYHRAVEEEA